MISFIGNRPALQIGPYQLIEYDTVWLESAIRRAACAADQADFPLATEICNGIDIYLENNCPLRLLHLSELFERLRKMLIKIGCERIADKLEPLAPPLTVSLIETAIEAGNGFELVFFEKLRGVIDELKNVGAEDIRFVGLRECALILRGQNKWTKQCDALLAEITAFLESRISRSENLKIP